MKPRKIITVCMGSSCFARGNRENLEIIKSWLAKQKREGEVKLIGALCRENCRRGPVIHLNEEMFTGVEPSDLPDLLTAFYEDLGEENA